MKLKLFSFALLAQSILMASPKIYQVSSPDNHLTIKVKIENKINISVSYYKQQLLDNSPISMLIDIKELGLKPNVLKVENLKIDEILRPPVPLKNETIHDLCNVLKIGFKDNYQLEFRAYNNAAAYRFVTDIDSEITVINENAEYNFSDNYKAYFAKTKSFFSSYEHLYDPAWLQDLNEDDMAILPTLLDTKKSTMILVAESDVFDYPAMFMKGAEGNELTASFPKYPDKTEPWHDRRLKITQEADYIAKTWGKRNFPWRIFMLSKGDKDLLSNDLVYTLARPCLYKKLDWIKPGQVSWEWWHASNIYGVDFKSGLNTDTYKYYIDFASHYGVEYIIMDEGWSKSTTEIFEPNPDIDLMELIRYGKEKNVKIILWLTWLAAEENQNLFKIFHDWGVAGVKIDFMNRSDQWMINYYERMSKLAFENELLVDFHGSISPKGMRRAYPNIISFEGVVGMEQNKGGGWDTPNHHVILPFTRNLVGPMDYTPGAMKSVHPKYWVANWTNPMSIGTRAHQMALFVVFESGLQMLADNPADYYREDECTKFITSVPTTWQQTVVLAAKAGEYVVTAKRNGEEWFIGGISNDKSHEIEISLSFLDKGVSYSLTSFTDGANADRYATDYKKTTRNVNIQDKIIVKMEMNGGFAAKLIKK